MSQQLRARLERATATLGKRLKKVIPGSKRKRQYQEEIQGLQEYIVLLEQEILTSNEGQHPQNQANLPDTEATRTSEKSKDVGGDGALPPVSAQPNSPGSAPTSAQLSQGTPWVSRIPQGDRDDQYFSIEFSQLKIRVQQWVLLSFFSPKQHIGQRPKFASLERSLQERIRKLGFDEDSVDLGNQRLLRDIIKMVVADELQGQVLTKFLGGMISKQSEDILQSLLDERSRNVPEKYPEIIKCKISLVDLFTPVGDQPALPAIMKTSIYELVKALAPLAADSSFSIAKRAKSLESIFESAIILVLELRKQPHEFIVPYIQPGSPCDETMDIEGAMPLEEAIQAKGEHTVRGVIFPPLLRAGLKNDLPGVLVKASVLLEPKVSPCSAIATRVVS